VVRIFPSRASAVRLIGAHGIEANEQWPERRYLRMEPEQIEEGLAAWAAGGASTCSSLRCPTLAGR